MTIYKRDEDEQPYADIQTIYHILNWYATSICLQKFLVRLFSLSFFELIDQDRSLTTRITIFYIVLSKRLFKGSFMKVRKLSIYH